MNDRTCSMPDCGRRHSARGLCRSHYAKKRAAGEFTDIRPFRRNVQFQDCVSVVGACWIWTGHVAPNGYGRFKNKQAHRLSYEQAGNSIPNGMLLDHMCHTPLCVNPEHLRPVTRKQNAEHRIGANRTSKSGVRGVIWDKNHRKWRGCVRHHGKQYWVKSSDDVKEVEQRLIELRNKLFTHNDADRKSA